MAVSDDGLRWERPDLDILPGTNVVLPHEFPERSRDSFCPLLDYGAEDPAERFKAYLFVRHGDPGRKRRKTNENWLMTSGDGFHWEHVGRFTARGGDGTTLHYNPFRQKWVLNLKHGYDGMRGRSYLERDRFRQFLRLREADQPAPGLSEGEVLWVGADRLDLPDPDWVVQEPTQLYMLEVVPYESIMLGVFAIHYGPHNDICEKGKFPKLTQIKLGYSRDGFHWHRPDREVFIGATKRDGDWDRAYLRPAAGCVIARDRLHFYYSGFSGMSPSGLRDIYAGGSTHVASIRRDGFVSMDAGEETGELVTRPLTFKGRHLFVNLDAPNGELTGRSTRPGRWRGRALFHREMHTRERRWDLHPGPLARSWGPLGCRRYARHADAVPIPIDERQPVCLLGHLRSRRQEPRLRRLRWARLRRPQRRVTGRSPPGP